MITLPAHFVRMFYCVEKFDSRKSDWVPAEFDRYGDPEEEPDLPSGRNSLEWFRRHNAEMQYRLVKFTVTTDRELVDLDPLHPAK